MSTSTRNAYVTAVENTINEIKGAVVIALALKAHDPHTPRICLIAQFVTPPFRSLLEEYFDLVLQFPPIKRSVTVPTRDGKPTQITTNLLRFATLDIDPKRYDTVMFVSPQLLPVISSSGASLADLFDVQTPAIVELDDGKVTTDVMVLSPSKTVSKAVMKATASATQNVSDAQLLLDVYQEMDVSVTRLYGVIARASPNNRLPEEAVLQRFPRQPWLSLLGADDPELEGWYTYAQQVSELFDRNLKEVLESNEPLRLRRRYDDENSQCHPSNSMMYVHNTYDRMLQNWLNGIPYMLTPGGSKVEDVYCIASSSRSTYALDPRETENYGRVYLLTDEQFTQFASFIDVREPYIGRQPAGSAGGAGAPDSLKTDIGRQPAGSAGSEGRTKRLTFRQGVFRASVRYDGNPALFRVLAIPRYYQLWRIGCSIISVNGAPQFVFRPKALLESLASESMTLDEIWQVISPGEEGEPASLKTPKHLTLTDRPFVEKATNGIRIISDEIQQAMSPIRVALSTPVVPPSFYSWFWGTYIPSLQQENTLICGLHGDGYLFTTEKGYIRPPANDIAQYTACLKDSTKRFAGMGVAVKGAEANGHQCFILYDKTLNELEFFDPWGGNSFLHQNTPIGTEKKILVSFAKDMGIESPKYFVPLDYCPRIGPQKLEAYARTLGYCQWWSMWYIELRITNPLVPRDEVMAYATRQLRQFGAEEFIMRYGHLLQKKCLAAMDVPAHRYNINANYFPFTGLSRQQLLDFVYGYCSTIDYDDVILQDMQYGVTPYRIPFNYTAFADNTAMPLTLNRVGPIWSARDTKRYASIVITKWTTKTIVKYMDTIRYWIDAKRLSGAIDSDELIFSYPNGFEADPDDPSSKRSFWDVKALSRNADVMTPSLTFNAANRTRNLFFRFPRGLPVRAKADGTFVYEQWDWKAISAVRCITSTDPVSGQTTSMDLFVKMYLNGEYSGGARGSASGHSVRGPASGEMKLDIAALTRNTSISTAGIISLLHEGVWDLSGLGERIEDYAILQYIAQQPNGLQSLDVHRVSVTIMEHMIDMYRSLGGALDAEALSTNTFISYAYVDAHPEIAWNLHALRNRGFAPEEIESLLETGTCRDVDLLNWRIHSRFFASYQPDQLSQILPRLDPETLSNSPYFRVEIAERYPTIKWDWRGVGQAHGRVASRSWG